MGLGLDAADCIGCQCDDAAIAALWRGRLAQLVEHLVYTERVGGSSPSPPTNAAAAAGAGHALAAVGALLLALALLGAGLARARRARADDFQRRAHGRAPQCGVECPEVVVADGVIEPDTPAAFLDFARQAAVSPGLRGVVLHQFAGRQCRRLDGARRRRSASCGMAAIVAGYATSDGGVSGPIAGECVSACVYALMGAVQAHRAAAQPGRAAPHVGRR